jgi:hypothetical protein
MTNFHLAGRLALAFCSLSGLASNAHSADPGVRLIIDNISAAQTDGAFTKNGTWTSLTDSNAYVANPNVAPRTHLQAAGQSISTLAKWTPNLTKAGTYKIYVHSAGSATGAAKQVPVEIKFSGGIDLTRRIDQTHNIGAWTYVGTYHMAKQVDVKQSHYVALRASEVGTVSADAVMFELASEEAAPRPASATPKEYFVDGQHFQKPSQVEIVRTELDPKSENTERSFELRVNGAAFYAKGVAGQELTSEVVQAGGNAIRTYSTKALTEEFMWQASEAGLKVVVGLWLLQGGDGHYVYDFDKPIPKGEKYPPRCDGECPEILRTRAALQAEIARLKKYNAVLAWSIGNEIDPESMTAEEATLVYREIDIFAQHLRAVDHWHPTLSVHAGSSRVKIRNIITNAPDVSMVAFNSYVHLDNVDGNVVGEGWIGPYMVTEFSIRQPSESSGTGEQTSWHSVVEPTSKAKYDYLLAHTYSEHIWPNRQREVGSFFFKGKDAFRLTPTWYPLFDLQNRITPSRDAMHQLWTGVVWPIEAPQIDAIKIDGSLPSQSPIVVGQDGDFISTVTMKYPIGRTQADYEFKVEIRKDTTVMNAECRYPAVLSVTKQMSGNDQTTWLIRKADLPAGLYRLYYTVTGASQGTAMTASYANSPFCRLGPNDVDCSAYSLQDLRTCPPANQLRSVASRGQ